MIKLINKSAHHGCINHQNQLKSTLELLVKYPEIGIVEIDFVYHEFNFISSHDYTDENISLGSTLEEWLQHIIYMKKLLWIDIKDCILSILSDKFIEFDIIAFYKYLSKLEIEFPNLKDHLLISCQYSNTYEKLVKYNTDYIIVHDMPQDYAYALVKLRELDFIDSLIHEKIQSALKGITGIVSLDKIFFNNVDEITKFINTLETKTIIVYSYDLHDTNIPIVPGKHIIYQYNYLLS